MQTVNFTQMQDGTREEYEFLERMDSRSVNRRVLECLVKTGAFDFSLEPRGAIFHRLEEAMNYAAARQRDAGCGQPDDQRQLQRQPRRLGHTTV